MRDGDRMRKAATRSVSVTRKAASILLNALYGPRGATVTLYVSSKV